MLNRAVEVSRIKLKCEEENISKLGRRKQSATPCHLNLYLDCPLGLAPNIVLSKPCVR